MCACVTSISNSCLGGTLRETPSLCLCERSLYSVSRGQMCGSGLLISMHGMSVEARGPETQTRSYCGPREERRGEERSGEENRPNISVQQTLVFICWH